jgi:hypothetical protein
MSVNIGLMFVAKLTAIGRSLSWGSVAGGLAVDLGGERGPHPFGNFWIMPNGPWFYAPDTDDAARRTLLGGDR